MPGMLNSQAIFQLFTQTIVPDQQARNAAEQHLKQAEQVDGFMSMLLQMIGSNEIQDAIKQSIAIFFKNRVRRGWETEKQCPIGPQDRIYIKSHILAVMVHIPPRLR